MAMVVGMETGRVVVMVRIVAVVREDDLTIQLRTEEPSFPALSLAVTRIMKVPETSIGTLREYVPDFARFLATVSHVFPLSFENPISTPETPLVSVALQVT